jgi:hypothetical protein
MKLENMEHERLRPLMIIKAVKRKGACGSQLAPASGLEKKASRDMAKPLGATGIAFILPSQGMHLIGLLLVSLSPH